MKKLRLSSWFIILIGHNFIYFFPLPCFQLVPKLTRNFVKEGYMEKTGPRASQTDASCSFFQKCFQKFISQNKSVPSQKSFYFTLMPDIPAGKS